MEKATKIKRIIAIANHTKGVNITTNYYTNGVDFILYSKEKYSKDLDDAIKKFGLIKDAEFEDMYIYHEAHFRIKIR